MKHLSSFCLDHSSTFSSYHSLTSSTMQSSTNSTNIAAMATGIVPPPMHSPQSSYMMQSTTPSVANGKDEMRGWLYKWTNVIFFSSSVGSPTVSSSSVSQRLSKTLVRSSGRYLILLSVTRRNESHVPRNGVSGKRSTVLGRIVSFHHLQWFNGHSSSHVE